MNFNKTKIKDLYIIEPQVHGDSRGWFAETYSKGDFDGAGLYYDFVQDNQSFSKDIDILRGLHFQNNPMAQAKLVRCTQGAIVDVAVDIRRGSDSYLQSVALELSAENRRMLMIPRGFAHGFATLSDDVMVQYKVDNLYSREHDRSIQWNDPTIGVRWNVANPALSQKDTICPTLANSDCNFTIKVMVTGACGQLGHDVIKRLESEGYQCLGVDITDFDITNESATVDFIKRYNPYVVVHCSAYTAVDKAETDTERCHAVNVVGSHNIAKACQAIDAKMVYISTDYVYDGLGNQPFETDSAIAPLSVYGKTKYKGEEECRRLLSKLFVIRTSWVFGKNGNNFVKTMMKLGRERDILNVVDDQIGSPTYTVDLADFIFYILNSQKYGTYHCSNEEYCSWKDFAKEILKLAKIKTPVEGIPTSQYKTAATRPLNSRLSKKCLQDCGYGNMPSWKDALKRYLKEINQI